MRGVGRLGVLGLLVSVLTAYATAASDPASPVLSRIHGRNELVVGTAASMPPFNMTTKTG